MARHSLRKTLPGLILDEQQRVEKCARERGLDFFPVLFEMISYDQMNEIAAFGGFPTRYPHWRFGMEYEQLAKSYEYGLSKIYEMVINNNPAVAYLLEGNMYVDQKLVMAHVYAHVDFFKNNFAFQATNQGHRKSDGTPIRKWVDTMANHGTMTRRWIRRIGIDKVEEFIDTCLSLENLIDPHAPFAPSPQTHAKDATDESSVVSEEPSLLHVERDYMARFINPDEFVEAQRRKIEERKEQPEKFPKERVKDVMGFLLDHAPLKRWERELLRMIRTEAYYFLPQMQTKIMNEGWATYWHSRMMTEELCTDSEIIDYADRCAGVLATQPGQLNPYKLGVELFRHIESRWNRGQFGKEWDDCDDPERRRNWDRRTNLGQEKIFEVRAIHNDLTFIDEFLTPEFVAEQKMYSFGYNERNDRWEIESRTFNKVKKQLLTSLTNVGNPFIYVEDANYQNRGELLLVHDHHGIDLRLDWAENVLESLNRMWSRPVALSTIVEETKTTLHYDGSDHTQSRGDTK